MGETQTTQAYRGRIAPSPTGLLHLGHASTFLAAAARAREAGGTLVLRNEDLDRQRARPEFAEAMFEDLHWLGIRWQEGPDCGGPYAPYTQSECGAHYLAAWRALLDRGLIYPCRCSRKDLATAISAPHENGDDEEPMYPGTCRPLPDAAVIAADAPSGVNWRFRVPDGEAIEFSDQHFSLQHFVSGRDFGDFLIWRRDGVPSYQMACVVDDAAMQITEVVRGADLLKSTARQILLYRAFGLEPPLWYHCPLVTDAHGQRLAKRNDALALRTMRQKKMSPEEVSEQARPASKKQAYLSS